MARRKRSVGDVRRGGALRLLTPTKVPRISKKVERALNDARLYIGSSGTPIKVQERLYKKVIAHSTSIAEQRNMNTNDVWQQLMDKAVSVGPIVPRPGKDY